MNSRKMYTRRNARKAGVKNDGSAEVPRFRISATADRQIRASVIPMMMYTPAARNPRIPQRNISRTTDPADTATVSSKRFPKRTDRKSGAAVRIRKNRIEGSSCNGHSSRIYIW